MYSHSQSNLAVRSESFLCEMESDTRNTRNTWEDKRVGVGISVNVVVRASVGVHVSVGVSVSVSITVNVVVRVGLNLVMVITDEYY